MNNLLSILIVDDQPENLLALEAMLEGRGHRLVRAYSGREALRKLLEDDFALILLDVQMPSMDGFETASLIRQRERSTAIPIIFLTAAMKSEEMVFKGYLSGAVDYLIKPVMPEILQAKVAVFMDLAAARQKLEKELFLRKRAEEKIQLLNAELHQHVAKVEEANKELEAFSYSVSHDLRAPLRHIHGYVDFLTEATNGQLSEQALHYLQVISNASAEMGKLIDDLLAFSRMGRTEMHEQEVELDKLVQQAIASLEMETRGRTLKWKIAALPTVCGDAALLKQVLINLLGNAVKYSRPQEAAEIEVGYSGEEDERLILFVRDNGVGFDMRYVNKLFGVFQRLHRADEFEGTGIGLATVRRIINRHGGRTWAESELNHGATIYFTLKVASVV